MKIIKTYEKYISGNQFSADKNINKGYSKNFDAFKPLNIELLVDLHTIYPKVIDDEDE